MSAILTISAVNSTTDQLTIAAHGLTTGDICRPYSPGNGSLPTPLAQATDCYAIRVDANTIKLAATNALALAGTAIDLTTNGSGALYLLVGVPFQRQVTYGVGVQIKSANLNDMEDALRDNWTTGRHGQRTRWFPATTPNLLGSGNTMAEDGLNIGTSNDFQGMALGGWNVGSRICALTLVMGAAGSGYGTFTLKLRKLNAENGNSDLVTATIPTSTGAGVVSVTALLTSPISLIAGDALALSQASVPGSGSWVLHQIGVTYDRAL